MASRVSGRPPLAPMADTSASLRMIADRGTPQAAAIAADGRIALAGAYDGELDLGSGVVLTGPPGDLAKAFVAQFASDGTVEWGTFLEIPDSHMFAGLALIEDAVLLAGRSYASNGAAIHRSDALVMAMRDGEIEWQVSTSGPHLERADDLLQTADDTVLVVLDLDLYDYSDDDPTVDLGRLRLESPSTAVVELAP